MADDGTGRIHVLSGRESNRQRNENATATYNGRGFQRTEERGATRGE